MYLEKGKTVTETSVTSELGYSPLIWMFRSRRLINKKNYLHERALRITYGNKCSSFQDLLRKGNSVFIHLRNTQTQVTELIKVKNNIAYEAMREFFFPKISPYDDSNNNSFQKRRVILSGMALNQWFMQVQKYEN